MSLRRRLAGFAPARSAVHRVRRVVCPLPRLDWYEPISTLTLPANLVETARFPAIDAHNHLGRWLDRQGNWMAPDVGLLRSCLESCNIVGIVNLDGRWGAELDANLQRFDRAFPGQ